MACSQILAGISNDCAPSLGGVKIVYIANYADVASTSINAGSKISAITMETGKKFYAYEFRRNTANMTSTLNIDAANGNSVSTDVVLQFLKQDTQKRIEMAALSIGELAVMVKDGNDKYWYLGHDFPVQASAGSAETGTAFTDGNKYNITLNDISLSFPYEIKVAPESESDTDYVDLDEIIA